MQWAAVITQVAEMSEPPQMYLPLLCKATCHGQAPGVAVSPPITARGVGSATDDATDDTEGLPQYAKYGHDEITQ